MKQHILYLISSIFLFLGIVTLTLWSKHDTNFHTAPLTAEDVQNHNAQEISQDQSPSDCKRDSAISHLATVRFAINSNKLNPSQTEKVSSVLSSVQNTDGISFILDGYTDSIGSDQVNSNLLATLRSFSVYEYLVQSGIKKENIFIRSYGMQSSSSEPETDRKVDIFVSEMRHP